MGSDKKTRNPQQQKTEPQRQSPGQQHQQSDRKPEQGRNPGGQSDQDMKRDR